MTLSVTSATSALAALQALQTSDAATTAASTQTAAAAPAGKTDARSSVSTDIAQPGGLHTLADGLGQAMSLSDAAGAAGASVLGLLQQMQSLAGQASAPDADHAALDSQFQASAAQVAPTLQGATVNGTNLVDGSQTAPVKVALGGGLSASLTPQDLTLAGPVVGLSAGASIASPADATSTFDALGTAVSATTSALSTLQQEGGQISAHAGALQTLGQALALPEDASGDDARLLALQVGQQLSASGGAIANGSPSSVLALFR